MSTIPQNKTAEKAALSILSHHPERLSSLPWTVDLFFDPAHKTIFRAIESAAAAGEPADFNALTARLEAGGKLDTVGGAGALTEILITLEPGCAGLDRYYFTELSKVHTFRQTVQVARQNLSDLEKMQLSPLEFVERIGAAAQGPEIIQRVTLQEHIDALVGELECQEPPESFTTGLSGLDFHLGGGVHRGELLVVAGETSCGKSMLLSMAALASARAGQQVVFFSLEMPAKDVLRRMAANIAGFPIKGVHEKPNGKEMDAATRAIRALSSLPITIIDSLASLNSIESEMRRMTRLKKADVLIIDYLQLVENSTADNREQAIAAVARKLKNLALGCGCAVFTASQLNEEGKLRESRAIGHHADFVVSISSGTLVVVKNRRGPPNVSIPVKLRGELGRFEESNSSDQRTALKRAA